MDQDADVTRPTTAVARADDTTLRGIDQAAAETAAPAPPAILRELAGLADVRFNGDRPWDIRVLNPRLYERIIRQGSLGFGEAYVDGDWEADDVDGLVCRLLSADVDEGIRGIARSRFIGSLLRTVLVNRQSQRRAFEVGERHYDIGNDVYEAMLDPTMSYSCAYWKDADNLADAQLAKLKLVCDKLQLEPGQRLLDIGCGWGGLARFAAAHYGAEVVGITVSREQAALARERCRDLPVRIELMDYRDIEGRYDRVVSVGMFEHVGPKNYAAFFATAGRVMTDDGLLLLHTIGLHRTTPVTDDWIEKYIFPNSKLPSPTQLTAGFEPHFILEDWHKFRQDYDRTLMAWWDNFQSAWPRLEARYGQRFYRMWKYYLLCCAGFFRSRQGQLWQLVLAKRSRQKVYRSVR